MAKYWNIMETYCGNLDTQLEILLFFRYPRFFTIGSPRTRGYDSQQWLRRRNGDTDHAFIPSGYLTLPWKMTQKNRWFTY
jgi:hypothetical protein